MNGNMTRAVRRVLWVSVAALQLALAGCAVSEESRRALSNYTDAMRQVDQGAQQFLTDFSDSVKVQQAHLALARGVPPVVAPEYPSKLTLPGDAPQTETERRVEATRQALTVVRSYNDALVALAEGRPVSEIRTRLGELGGQVQTLATLAGAALPALGPLVAIGPQLVKLAQDSMNRAELQRAVLQGRPLVRQILTTLEQQAPTMYESSVAATTQAQTDLRDTIQRAAFALRGATQQYSPPTDPKLAGELSDMQAQMDTIGRRTLMRTAMPLPTPFGSGRPPYDTQVNSQVKVFVASMAATSQKYGDLVAKQNAYFGLLQKYVLAVRAARTSLDKLEESLESPTDVAGETNRLLKVAFDLRDALAAYRTPPAAP